jgi:4a-hydroxytetrahydrobiopterin dehydratase
MRQRSVFLEASSSRCVNIDAIGADFPIAKHTRLSEKERDAMAALSEQEIQSELATLPGWTSANGTLTKTYVLPGFPDSIALVNAAAEIAEEHGHHPDIDIRYNRVTFALSTHDAGNAVTEKDIALARAIEDFSHAV